MDLKTRLDNGRLVSTVRLPNGQFETMVFPENSWEELSGIRTVDEALAKHNHANACKAWEG